MTTPGNCASSRDAAAAAPARLGSEHLAAVAKVYDQAAKNGKYPAQAVYMTFGMMPRRLDRHIRRCRDLDLIPHQRRTMTAVR
jgi:hypothetical protein